MDEKQLVGKLKNGDHESFAFLFEQCSGKLYSLAFRMCGNREDAEDIVQRTFVQAFININNFKAQSSLYTWLYAIAKNLCLRLLENRGKSTFSSLDQLIHTASQESRDDFTAVEKQYYINQVKEGCLLGLLRCLPFYQRIAFILNVLLDVKARDIAAIINKSETAARLLIHRAKQNIKTFLCKNCSFYYPDNPCHCENLIDFSLKQSWIQKLPDTKATALSQITPLEIETEINDLKKITLLYNSLEDRPPSESMIRDIQQKIGDSQYQIFNR
jgi:RNA polymerase sigma factor (sigma-70 family)